MDPDTGAWRVRWPGRAAAIASRLDKAVMNLFDDFGESLLRE